MFGSYEDLDAGTQAIQAAYFQIVEKKQAKDQEALEKEVTKVEKELEKVADKIEEQSFMDAVLALFEENDGKIRVSPEKVAELQRKAAEYKSSLTPADMDRFAEAMMKKFSKADDEHKDIHDQNGSLKESTRQERLKAALKGPITENVDYAAALIEAMTDTDFEARAKVAASTKDADLLSAMAQNHMNEDAPGAAEICNYIARNPATPNHILEKLASHPNPKVVESANNNIKAQDNKSGVTESFDMGGRHLTDDHVIKQYLAGKPAERRKGTVRTDGKSYFLHGNEIARKNDAGEHEFSWEGWYTPTTERHLNTILKQVAPGKSVNKVLHKKQGVERFAVKDLMTPEEEKTWRAAQMSGERSGNGGGDA